MQHGVERDNQYTVACDDDKRAEAKGQHPQHNFSRIASEADADVYPVAEQKPQDKQAGARLRKNGSNRCTGDTHVQSKDEDRVQDNIHHRSDDGGQHRLVGKALAGDELVESCRQDGKHRTHHIIGQIAVCIGEGLLARTKEHQHRLPKCNRQSRQSGRKCQQHNKAVGKNLLCALPVVLSHADCHQRCTADSNQKSK